MTSKARTLQGVVLSNKMKNTVVVKVERRLKHPLYEKYIKRSSKIHAHDAEDACQIGDIVRIREGRPIAKTVSWFVDKIIERAE